MILRDPPTHTRLRGLVMASYTPRRVQQLTPQIDAAARSLIAGMRRAGPGVDLLTAFALPLTVQMTALMLGLATDDLEKLTAWSRALAAVIDLNQAEEIRARVRVAVRECTEYVRQVIGERRASPRDDLISALIQQPGERAMSDEELVGTVTHLLFVGNDPVMHMFGNALITLSSHPVQRAWLAANPDKVEGALDEIMRYDSPVQMTFRYALADVELHGKQMRVGDHVAVVLGAANRDPYHFASPDTLDLTRPVGTPAHFGMGIHYCLGAPLARLEGQVGLRALMAELPNLRPAIPTAQLEWQQTVAVRGVTTLPVEF
jgi:cytochrome P450